MLLRIVLDVKLIVCVCDGTYCLDHLQQCPFCLRRACASCFVGASLECHKCEQQRFCGCDHDCEHEDEDDEDDDEN